MGSASEGSHKEGPCCRLQVPLPTLGYDGNGGWSITFDAGFAWVKVLPPSMLKRLGQAVKDALAERAGGRHRA